MQRTWTTPFTDDVRELVRTARFELIPIKAADEALALIPRTTTVTITCSPTFGLERTVALAERASVAGRRVVPHVAARQVTGPAELRSLIDRFRAAGIGDLYVISGDQAEPSGPYESALALLEELAQIDHDLQSIGIACYPEGHPLIADEVLQDALARKQQYADYMVSQMCFHADALVDWLRRTRQSGIELPLNIGLAGPMDVRRLAQLSLKIGVGPSLRYLTKQHGLVGSLLRGSHYEPERLLEEMNSALSDPELGVARLHLFSFNQVEKAVGWQERVLGETRRGD